MISLRHFVSVKRIGIVMAIMTATATSSLLGKNVYASDVIADISSAISSTIRWQEQWFGKSFGAACIRARAERRADLIVFFPNPQYEPQIVGSRSFAAYVEGSNVLYSGKLWPDKAVAEPSAGNPGSCGPGEIAAQVDFTSRPGNVARGPFALDLRINTGQVALADSTRVAAMVMRSLKTYYSAKHMSIPQGMRLADYSISDPFLLATGGKGSQLQLLDFPPLGSIDDNTVVAVYSGDIFLGPDVTIAERRRAVGHAFAELSKRSQLLN